MAVGASVMEVSAEEGLGGGEAGVGEEEVG